MRGVGKTCPHCGYIVWMSEIYGPYAQYSPNMLHCPRCKRDYAGPLDEYETVVINGRHVKRKKEQHDAT